MSFTLKFAIRVVPDTVCVSVPPPSLPTIGTRYSSTGLLPGSAASQDTSSVSVSPEGSAINQLAVTTAGAEGGVVAEDVVTLIGAEAGPDPEIVAFTTVIWYVVWGCNDRIAPLVAI